MSDTRKMIEDCDKWTRDANMRAIRSQGWRKSVHLWFAGLFSWLGDWGREIDRAPFRWPILRAFQSHRSRGVVVMGQ